MVKTNVLLLIIGVVLNLFQVKSQNLQWSKYANSSGDTDSHGIASDEAGNLFLGGSFNTSMTFGGSTYTGGAATQTMYLAKIDNCGAVSWLTQFDCSTITGVSPLGIAAGSSHIYVCGSFYGTVDFDPAAATSRSLTSSGGADFFVAKYSKSDGSLVWAYKGGSTNTDILYSIALDASENVYLCGLFQGTVEFDIKAASSKTATSAGADDIIIAKYDSDGNYTWHYTIGNTLNDVANCIRVDASDNVYVTGKVTANASSATTVDFNGATAGGTISLATGYAGEAYLVKYNASGTLQFVSNIGRGVTDDAEGLGVAIDNSSDIYVSGTLRGTADFDPSASTQSKTSSGGPDMFVAKYNSSGGYSFVYTMGSTGFDVAKNLEVDNSGNLYLTGYFSETVNINPEGTAGAVNVGASSNRGLLLSSYTTDAFAYNWHVSGNNTNFSNSGESLALDRTTSPVGIHLFGYYKNTIDFNPNGTATTSTTSNSNDSFVAKYSSAAEFSNPCDLTLPVELLHFKSTCSNNDVEISWSTATEVKNDYFTVEMSLNNENWHGVEIVKGFEQSYTTKNYSVTRKSSQSGAYYRLKQTDVNGAEKIYNSIYAEPCENSEVDFVLFPNPASNNLHFSNDNLDIEEISFYNSSGVLILQEKFSESVEGYSFDISKWSDGLYFVSLTHRQGFVTQKVVVKQ